MLPTKGKTMKQKQLLIELVNQSKLFEHTFGKKTEQKAYDNKYKPHIIDLVVECLLGVRAHKEAPNYFNLGSAVERRKTFKQFDNKDCFDYFNGTTQVFQEELNYKQGSHTKGWTFTPYFKKRMDSLIKIADGLKPSQFGKWVTDVPQHDKVTYIEPSLEGMQSFFDDDTKDTRDRLIMWAYMVAFATHKGRIPQYYKKGGKTGLYYPVGALAITNKPAVMRNAIMAEYHEYDLNCAAFAIIQSLTGDKFTVMDSYISDPKGFREQIATDCSMGYEEVKKCFFSLSFGGRLTSYGSVANYVTNASLKAFRDNKTVQAFQAELKDATERLYDFYPVELNKVKAERVGNSQYSSKFRVRMYQSQLNSILEAIQNEYGKVADVDNCLFVYDAIYIKKYMTLNTLETAIIRDTGLNIKVTYENL